jgi:hypothetical protein
MQIFPLFTNTNRGQFTSLFKDKKVTGIKKLQKRKDQGFSN